MQRKIQDFTRNSDFLKTTDLTKSYPVKKGSKAYQELKRITKGSVIYEMLAPKLMGQLNECVTIYQKSINKHGFCNIDHFATIRLIKKEGNLYRHFLERCERFPHWLKVYLAKL